MLSGRSNALSGSKLAPGSGEDSIRRSREAGIGPGAPAAVHGDDVFVAHFLEIVGGERGTETAAAIENERGVFIGDGCFDVALDDASAEMDSTGNVALGPFVVLARVDENHFFAGIEALLDFAKIGFLDSRFGVVDDGEKCGRVMVRHL